MVLYGTLKDNLNLNIGISSEYERRLVCFVDNEKKNDYNKY